MKDFLLKDRLTRIYFLLPVFLFSGFLIIFILNQLLKIWIEKNYVLSQPVNTSKSFEYPVIKQTFIPKISATGAIIMDADSKIVLYSKNPDLRFSPASTTKLMTSLVALDYFKPQDILTVKIASREGSIIGLKVGEKLTLENLIYAMLLPSANDAAYVIAQNHPQGYAKFIDSMNKKANELVLLNTHFGDPAGLLDNQNYTTAFDLARLASFAVANPLIKKIVATREKYITDATGNFIYRLENLNELLGIDGVNGVKTGYTEEAGQVLVTSKIEEGRTIIIVIMGSEDRFLDTQKLLELVDNNLSFLSIHP
ncbi:MAG: D-alanyl-D-alanine carboxypeptidase [Candidatus Levybacteria bacterium]|nr:D-alanyl-D-alanine carboxypeptidase [Candidatus Levybacteria bacterium]